MPWYICLSPLALWQSVAVSINSVVCAIIALMACTPAGCSAGDGGTADGTARGHAGFTAANDPSVCAASGAARCQYVPDMVAPASSVLSPGCVICCSTQCALARVHQQSVTSLTVLESFLLSKISCCLTRRRFFHENAGRRLSDKHSPTLLYLQENLACRKSCFMSWRLLPVSKIP